jgi:hypothetical protein
MIHFRVIIRVDLLCEGSHPVRLLSSKLGPPKGVRVFNQPKESACQGVGDHYLFIMTWLIG